MSKTLRTIVSTLALLAVMSLSATALANVLRDDDGHPYGSVSNLGSQTAIDNRSEQGSAMKALHDGVRVRGSDY